MTKTLTEQWREGKLFGFHYVKVPKEKPEIHNVSCMDYLLDEYGVEVLAPVPSYDEYNELKTRVFISGKMQEVAEMVVGQLEKQLAIATKALKYYDGLENIIVDWKLLTGQEAGTAKNALKEIEEVK